MIAFQRCNLKQGQVTQQLLVTGAAATSTDYLSEKLELAEAIQGPRRIRYRGAGKWHQWNQWSDYFMILLSTSFTGLLPLLSIESR